MYKCLMSFFINNKKNSSPFNEQYRKSYKNAWINNIKNYTP